MIKLDDGIGVYSSACQAGGVFDLCRIKHILHGMHTMTAELGLVIL